MSEPSALVSKSLILKVCMIASVRLCIARSSPTYSFLFLPSWPSSSLHWWCSTSYPLLMIQLVSVCACTYIHLLYKSLKWILIRQEVGQWVSILGPGPVLDVRAFPVPIPKVSCRTNIHVDKSSASLTFWHPSHKWDK